MLKCDGQPEVLPTQSGRTWQGDKTFDVMDTHSHYVPISAAGSVHPISGRARLETATSGCSPLLAVSVDDANPDSVIMMIKGNILGTFPRSLIDIEVQARAMANMGITKWTLAIPPFLFQYELPEDESTALCRSLNNGIHRTAQEYDGSCVPVGTLPMRHMDQAINELRRCVKELGFRAVTVATNVLGRDLDDPGLRPFFREACRLNVAVILHPHYVVGQERMNRYHLRNLIGNPVDTVLAAGSLIFGGVMKECPDLKVVLPHGGGYVPYAAGRFSRAYKCRSECRGSGEDPAEALRRFYYDTITHSSQSLSWLLEFADADKVVLGSDFPFDMGEEDPVGRLAAALDEDAIEAARPGQKQSRRRDLLEKVLCTNAMVLFPR